MNVKQLKDLIKDLDDDTIVFTSIEIGSDEDGDDRNVLSHTNVELKETFVEFYNELYKDEEVETYNVLNGEKIDLPKSFITFVPLITPFEYHMSLHSFDELKGELIDFRYKDQGE